MREGGGEKDHSEQPDIPRDVTEAAEDIASGYSAVLNPENYALDQSLIEDGANHTELLDRADQEDQAGMKILLSTIAEIKVPVSYLDRHEMSLEDYFVDNIQVSDRDGKPFQLYKLQVEKRIKDAFIKSDNIELLADAYEQLEIPRLEAILEQTEANHDSKFPHDYYPSQERNSSQRQIQALSRKIWGLKYFAVFLREMIAESDKKSVEKPTTPEPGKLSESIIETTNPNIILDNLARINYEYEILLEGVFNRQLARTLENDFVTYRDKMAQIRSRVDIGEPLIKQFEAEIVRFQNNHERKPKSFYRR